MAAKSKHVIDVKDILALDENKDPIQVPVGDSKLVTFPDIFDMPIEEAEGMLVELNNSLSQATLTPTLKKWLSEEDYNSLIARYPSYRKLLALINRVLQRYESVWGSPGEEPTSG